MSNTTWDAEDKKLRKFEEKLEIPNFRLSNVKSLKLKTGKDFNKIPKGGGCYWIWTNEPILHSLHKDPLPKRFSGGIIIYNGVAKDDVRGRIKHHLYGDPNAGWSGISIDIALRKFKSHNKKAAAKSGKVALIGGIKIKTKESLLKINLSKEEKNYIKKNKLPFYFRNGIRVSDKKHKKYLYKVYFIIGLKSAGYLELIEKKWREKHGLPQLCTYKSGR